MDPGVVIVVFCPWVSNSKFTVGLVGGNMIICWLGFVNVRSYTVSNGHFSFSCLNMY